MPDNVLPNRPAHSPTRYARQLADRREADRIEQFANFGLALGWVFLLVGGFCWFCAVSAVDGVWLAMLVTGIALLTLAVLIPESLAIPCRWWMKLARWQGWLVMTVLLTLVYFTLITPAGWLLRRCDGTHPFHHWDDTPPHATSAPGWEPLRTRGDSSTKPAANRRRSLPWLLVSTIGFFLERGHYLLLPILLVLLVVQPFGFDRF